nr:hypothetical protein [Kibdelosporangium sp. MJ126-NF4]
MVDGDPDGVGPRLPVHRGGEKPVAQEGTLVPSARNPLPHHVGRPEKPRPVNTVRLPGHGLCRKRPQHGSGNSPAQQPPTRDLHPPSTLSSDRKIGCLTATDCMETFSTSQCLPVQQAEAAGKRR